MSHLTPAPSTSRVSHLAPLSLQVISKLQANDEGKEGPSHKIWQEPLTNDVKDTSDLLGGEACITISFLLLYSERSSHWKVSLSP